MRTLAVAASMLFITAGPLAAQDGEIPAPADAVRKLYAEHLADKGPLADETPRDSWPFLFGKDLIHDLSNGTE